MENEKRIAAGGLPEHLDIEEARVIPVPKNLWRILIDIGVRNTLNGNAKKLADEITEGATELKDSANAQIYRATNPSKELIDESIADYFRKLGK